LKNVISSSVPASLKTEYAKNGLRWI
jgi:hypothetical protein